MGKKSFNTVEGLQREIMKRANKALKNEVKDYVEDKTVVCGWFRSKPSASFIRRQRWHRLNIQSLDMVTPKM